MPSKAANVQFINYSFCEGALERLVTPPVVGARIGDDALHRGGWVVAPSTVSFRDGDRLTVGIEQNLIGIKAQASFGLKRPDGSETIDLTRQHVRNKNVPVV